MPSRQGTSPNVGHLSHEKYASQRKKVHVVLVSAKGLFRKIIMVSTIILLWVIDFSIGKFKGMVLVGIFLVIDKYHLSTHFRNKACAAFYGILSKMLNLDAFLGFGFLRMSLHQRSRFPCSKCATNVCAFFAWCRRTQTSELILAMSSQVRKKNM